MKTYAVVTETLQKIVYIDAKSAEERYRNEDIVLDARHRNRGGRR